MLTRKFLNVYGIVGIVLMAILLLLIWLKIVPESYNIPLFSVALVLWASRMVLRMLLVRKERREASTDSQTPERENPQ